MRDSTKCRHATHILLRANFAKYCCEARNNDRITFGFVSLRLDCIGLSEVLFHDPLLALAPGFATLANRLKQAWIASFL